ncbi:MAG: hypothetical protein RLY87_2120 [Chloroflexota bacterium]
MRFRTVAQLAALVSVPMLLCALWLNIADMATLQSSTFLATLRQPKQSVSVRSLIGAALSTAQNDERAIYEALYPAQTAQYVALLLLPGLIDELHGDVRAGQMAYLIDQRLPVVVRDYVHDAPLCSATQERQIIAAIEQTVTYTVDMCRPVSAAIEQRMAAWLTGLIQRGFDQPEPTIMGIVYPLRIETSERLVYTSFTQYARYCALLVLVLWGIIIATTGMHWHRSIRWLGVVCISAGILGVSIRAVTESGQAFDGALLLQQYSHQAAWTGLPLGVLLQVLKDASFRDWSIISACMVLFIGTVGVGVGALPPRHRAMPVGELMPMIGTPQEHTPLHPSITAVVPTATVTDELPAGLVTNPLEIVRDEERSAERPFPR